jgi:hypothetical protein
VAVLVALTAPAELVAVTTTSIWCPTFFALSFRVLLVAPLIAEHFRTFFPFLPFFPFWVFRSQLSHWYAYAIGAVPVQVPVVAVSLPLFFALPLIVGRAVLAGLDVVGGATQLGYVPVSPAGHVGATQFGYVPVSPAGHVGGIVAKVAVTLWSEFIVTLQAPVPEQPPPDQPLKVEPEAGAAVRATLTPLGYAPCEQAVGQPIPVPVTLPVPLPVTDTVSVYVGGGVPTNAFPLKSTAAQNDADAHETEVSSIVPLSMLVPTSHAVPL